MGGISASYQHITNVFNFSLQTMNEKEKQRFHEMAEQDKKRYDLEMQSYVPPKDVKVGRGRKRNVVKDPNAPKRSLWVHGLTILYLP